MNSLKESSVITENTFGNNFAYVIENKNHFVNTDYKVLLSQTSDVFVKCMKLLYNGKIEIFYFSEEYTPLSDIVTNINQDTFMTIIANLFASIIEVQSNGFLSCQNIDTDWDKIYINPKTLKVKLVYIPVSQKSYNSYSEFENSIRSELIRFINRVIISPSPRVMQLSQDLSNGTLNIKDLYNKTKGEGTGILTTKVAEPRVEEKMHPVQNEYLKLVAINAPIGYFEIQLNKDKMLIGRERDSVDACIAYNNMISRKHCQIIRMKNDYYITDVGSANGTRINGDKLEPGQAYALRRGDILGLADSDFQVV